MSRERVEMEELRELVRLHRMGLGARKVAALLRISPNTERQYPAAPALRPGFGRGTCFTPERHVGAPVRGREIGRPARMRMGGLSSRLGKLHNHRRKQWKLPLPQFIDDLHFIRFGKTALDRVVSIEERARTERQKKDARRPLKQQRTTELT